MQIILANGQTAKTTEQLQTACKAKAIPFLKVETIKQQLKTICSDWQKAADADGQNLLYIQASVGLILDDLIRLLGFSEQDRRDILGHTLTNDIDNQTN